MWICSLTYQNLGCNIIVLGFPNLFYLIAILHVLSEFSSEETWVFCIPCTQAYSNTAAKKVISYVNLRYVIICLRHLFIPATSRTSPFFFTTESLSVSSDIRNIYYHRFMNWNVSSDRIYIGYACCPILLNLFNINCRMIH